MALLGCIADDFTGASDLANNLVRAGMRTVQAIGVEGLAAVEADAVDAIVVALKSRTAPVEQAVDDSREALSALQAMGCERFFFKYCSTFDSTPEGNIGPVAEALMSDIGVDFATAVPAFPATGRCVYQGVLFVNGVALNESGMQHHPLTPMTDANIVRWLAAQSEAAVGLVPYETVSAGAASIRKYITQLRQKGIGLAVVDALNDRHLDEIGSALAADPLVTGGSGIALGLPGAWRAAGLLSEQADAAAMPAFGGHCAVVSGSCSTRTQEQVAAFAKRHPAYQLSPQAVAADPTAAVEAALAWARPQLGESPVLIYSTQAPEAVAQVQSQLGSEQAGALVERALAAISQGLVASGTRRLIVAGGETSGAVVSALGVRSLRIGPQIDPGVPWTVATGIEGASEGIALALKSGNFGDVDFLTRAFEVCP